MSELSGLYALWLREIKVFIREKSRIVSSIINPLMWLVVFAGGLGASLGVSETFNGYSYQTYIYPGILVMTVLFSAVFFGVYIVWDKKLDFLKEVLVAPLSRTTIFFGKVLGGSTDSIAQILILLILGPIFAIHFTVFNVLATVLIIFLVATSLTSLGLIIGAFMESPEGFSLISGFVLFPIFFLSGALFPVNNLPTYLAIFVDVNPITYGVDALRGVLLGANTFSIWLDLLVLVVFDLIMIGIGTWAFRRMRI